jgi:hypothetical protein
MIILKYFLISTIFFSYSVKPPSVDHKLYNYEYAGGFKGALARNDNFKYDFYFLFERENDIKGYGNDVTIEYLTTENYPVLNLYDVNLKRKITSYARDVKGIDYITYDHVYNLFKNTFFSGLSLGYFNKQEFDLMYYLSLETDSLNIIYRIGKDNYIFKFKLFTEFKLYKSLYLQPLFNYVATDTNYDYQAKTMFNFKFS